MYKNLNINMLLLCKAIHRSSKNGTLINIVRLVHKIKDVGKTTSPDVIKYLDKQKDYKDIKMHVPKSLLRKYRTPENMYLINKDSAKYIASSIKKYLDKDCPVIEVNPGFGLLSQELLKLLDHLYMYESSNNFSSCIEELKKKYPNKITYKIADFFGMWKLAFQDKIDQGNRINLLLGNLATHDNDRTVKIIGAMPGLSFVKHLIHTVVFHHHGNQLGRPDLLIVMTPHHYEFLTDEQIQGSKHRSVPALFQMLFDYKVITKLPKVHYLPWMYPPPSKKLSVIEENCLYLVNITQKKKLPCSSDYLALLWYFFRPHMISKSTRVIPMLEQWIPGCGVWLITGQDPPDTNKDIGPGDDDAKLPHINIFTQYGDLTLNQKLTVFKKFISWPEFEHCPFRATMENNLPKTITAIDAEDKNNILPHLDEESDSDTEQS